MKRVGRWVAIAAVVLVLILVALPFLIQANTFRPMLESNLTQALGREVKVGDLKLAILSGGVSATDLSIADDAAFGKTPFVRAKELKVAVELVPLIFSRKLNITGLTIDQPEITLIESPSAWNFSSLGAKRGPESAAGSAGQAPLDLSVKSVKIANGRLTLGRTGSRSKPVVLEQVDIELDDFSGTSAFPFSFAAKVAGGGTVKLTGKAGPLDQGNVASTPLTASLKVADLDLALSGLNAMAPTLGGLVSFEGNGASDGKTVRVDGKLKAEKLKLARNATPARRVVEFVFAVEHDLGKHSGTLQRGEIHIGGAQASLAGAYEERGDSVILRMNLSGPNMAVTELAEMLPSLGIVLPGGSSLRDGTASVKLSSEGPADRLVTVGSVALSNARLAGFDLGRKMAVIERLAGIKSGPDTEIQTLSANVRYAPEGASAQDVKLVVAGIGEMTGEGTVSPQNALNFKMRVMAHMPGLAAAVSNTAIPFFIVGTSADPVFRPDIKGIATDQLNRIGGDAGKTAGDILKGFLGGKKK
jgi:AsmA protein